MKKLSREDIACRKGQTLAVILAHRDAIAQFGSLKDGRDRHSAASAALAVMGNHEFNAIAWATPDGNGDFLRPHTKANLTQHEAFLRQIGEGSSAYHKVIDWFRSLPLWLELPGLRIIHACWHAPSQRTLEETGAVDGKQRLTDVGLQTTSERGSEEFKAAEVLLKGPEIELPDRLSFEDRNGVLRTKARLRWWDRSAPTFRTAVLGMEGREHELPDGPVLHESVSNPPIHAITSGR